MLLRAHLPNDIAQAVRTYEITTNEGLGLNNSKLIEFVRQLEKNKRDIEVNFARLEEEKLTRQ